MKSVLIVIFTVYHATGTTIAEVIRKIGIAEQTFYNWKRRYADLGPGDVRRQKQKVTELSLDKHMLQDVLLRKL